MFTPFSYSERTFRKEHLLSSFEPLTVLQACIFFPMAAFFFLQSDLHDERFWIVVWPNLREADPLARRGAKVGQKKFAESSQSEYLRCFSA